MPKIFREIPPRELLEQWVKAIGMHGLEDRRWFDKTNIFPLILDPLLPLLEPYYYPCKAKQFLSKLDSPFCYITILRQLLHAHGFSLKAQEKTVIGVKGMWYQIQAEFQTQLDSERAITFD